MNTILERSEITLIRDRSSFIGVLIHVTSLESIKFHLEKIRKDYPKAKHYCYAYILGDKKKCSDDGEPAKTAGRPLLELLERKQMDEVLLIVVRYFGGVLLGASRLMSTYLESGVNVINNADLVSIENKYVYRLNLSYKEFDQLRVLAKKLQFSFENVSYEDRINVDVLTELDSADELINYFPHASIEFMGIKKVYRR